MKSINKIFQEKQKFLDTLESAGEELANLREFLRYARSLELREKPDYRYLEKLLGKFTEIYF